MLSRSPSTTSTDLLNRRLVVAVVAAKELERRAQLFAALARAFPVDFVPHPVPGIGRDMPDAFVAFDGATSVSETLPTLRLLSDPPPRDDREGNVTFASSPRLDQRLRAKTLTDARAGSVSPLRLADGEEVLAEGPSGPLWVGARGKRLSYRVALAPVELAPRQRLKNDLQHGRWLSLLPLVHFLRELTGYGGWNHPPLRATLMIDDVNLHWSSYGYVHLGRLAADAGDQGYHLSLAMVPLDASYASRRALDIVRSNRHLSLLIHGNDHVKCELARPVGQERALETAAQALRRVQAFERRTGLPVAPVVAPPHGACASVYLAALARIGLEAVTYRGSPVDIDDPLTGWHPGDLPDHRSVLGLQRVAFATPQGELLLRSYLDQPLILYGHHTDLREIDVLEEAVAAVAQLGPVVWMSPAELARSNYATAVVASGLRVRPFTRRLQLSVPAGVRQVSVESRLAGSVVEVRTGPSWTKPTAGPVGVPMSVTGPAELDVRLPVPDQIDPLAVPTPPRRTWPVVRRCLTEARDRAVPLVERVVRRGPA